MTDEGRGESAREELDRAAEELAAARQLLDAGFTRIALTRAYFAVFHAVRARLYAVGIEPRSHASTQRLFNLHFVKTGRMPPETSRLIARLQKFREEADYAEAFVVDAAGALEELTAATQLVERIRIDMSRT